MKAVSLDQIDALIKAGRDLKYSHLITLGIYMPTFEEDRDRGIATARDILRSHYQLDVPEAVLQGFQDLPRYAKDAAAWEAWDKDTIEQHRDHVATLFTSYYANRSFLKHLEDTRKQGVIVGDKLWLSDTQYAQYAQWVQPPDDRAALPALIEDWISQLVDRVPEEQDLYHLADTAMQAQELGYDLYALPEHLAARHHGNREAFVNHYYDRFSNDKDMYRMLVGRLKEDSAGLDAVHAETAAQVRGESAELVIPLGQLIPMKIGFESADKHRTTTLVMIEPADDGKANLLLGLIKRQLPEISLLQHTIIPAHGATGIPGDMEYRCNVLAFKGDVAQKIASLVERTTMRVNDERIDASVAPKGRER